MKIVLRTLPCHLEVPSSFTCLIVNMNVIHNLGKAGTKLQVHTQTNTELSKISVAVALGHSSISLCSIIMCVVMKYDKIMLEYMNDIIIDMLSKRMKS